MDISKYVELKSQGSDRVELSLEGDKVLIRQFVFDRVSGDLTKESELVPIAQLDEQIKQRQRQVDELQKQLDQFKAVRADITELQKG